MGYSVLRRSLESNPITLETLDKSDAPHGPTYNLSPPSLCVIAFITVAFAPAFFYIAYTVKSIYTTLAIVENPIPDAYDAVSSDETDGTLNVAAAEINGPAKPVTASLRRTYKLLRTVNGWRGNYRGFFLAAFISILSAMGTLVLAAIPFLPPTVASLIVSLALVQLQAAWVHTVIRANPSDKSIFRGDVPPFRRTFEATCIPTIMLWVANLIVTLVSVAVIRALKLDGFQFGNPSSVPQLAPDMVWKAIVVFFVAITLVFTLTFPANVVLIRVQASLLPPDQDTVVPFDRSFNGTVEPAVLGGRSYVTVKDAFCTLSRASWKRIVVLFIKLHALFFLINVFYAAAILPVFLLASQKTGLAV
ncbi:hypothetical protein SEPCBS57363_001343 [Sporothrix epigloea]|uniref:Ubiquitin carrier protein n=1 Tax=Sporothrix epigloea TaxID=1892477 RepID=A0ABP0D9Q5_9PEZI